MKVFKIGQVLYRWRFLPHSAKKSGELGSLKVRGHSQTHL